MKIAKNNIAFFLAIFLIFFIFFIFYLGIKRQEGKIETIDRYRHIAQYIKSNNLSKKQANNYLVSFSFKEPLDTRKIIKNSQIIYSHNDFQTFQYNNNYFLYLTFTKYKILYKDFYKDYNFLYVYIVFMIIFLFTIVTYLWLVNSLNLIQKAKENIHNLTDKNLNININDTPDDDFEESIKSIELLIQSKQLFLRTIMHELNTPIAKGRIVSELIEDDKQRIRVANIFDKLDFLVNDFLKLEQMLSYEHDLVTHTHPIHEVIHDALSALMIKNIEKCIFIDVKKSRKIDIDFSLMSIVFKNFIDNALKYSTDKKVKIKEQKRGILFISKGEKLTKTLHQYSKPYHSDKKLKKQGKGLGLYIIKSILDIHNFSLHYKYINGFNLFYIDFSKSSHHE